MQNITLSTRAVTIPLLILIGACATGRASLVRRDMQGGVLALHGPQNEAMDDAQKKMAAHCRGPFTIVGEEMVPVGVQTNQVGQSGYWRGAYSTSSMSTDVREYRVAYQCGIIPPPAYPGVAQPEQPTAPGQPGSPQQPGTSSQPAPSQPPPSQQAPSQQAPAQSGKSVSPLPSRTQ